MNARPLGFVRFVFAAEANAPFPTFECWEDAYHFGYSRDGTPFYRQAKVFRAGDSFRPTVHSDRSYAICDVEVIPKPAVELDGDDLDSIGGGS